MAGMSWSTLHVPAFLKDKTADEMYEVLKLSKDDDEDVKIYETMVSETWPSFMGLYVHFKPPEGEPKAKPQYDDFSDYLMHQAMESIVIHACELTKHYWLMGPAIGHWFIRNAFSQEWFKPPGDGVYKAKDVPRLWLLWADLERFKHPTGPATELKIEERCKYLAELIASREDTPIQCEQVKPCPLAELNAPGYLRTALRKILGYVPSVPGLQREIYINEPDWLPWPELMPMQTWTPRVSSYDPAFLINTAAGPAPTVNTATKPATTAVATAAATPAASAATTASDHAPKANRTVLKPPLARINSTFEQVEVAPAWAGLWARTYQRTIRRRFPLQKGELPVARPRRQAKPRSSRPVRGARSQL